MAGSLTKKSKTWCVEIWSLPWLLYRCQCLFSCVKLFLWEEWLAVKFPCKIFYICLFLCADLVFRPIADSEEDLFESKTIFRTQLCGKKSSCNFFGHFCGFLNTGDGEITVKKCRRWCMVIGRSGSLFAINPERSCCVVPPSLVLSPACLDQCLPLHFLAYSPLLRPHSNLCRPVRAPISIDI